MINALPSSILIKPITVLLTIALSYPKKPIVGFFTGNSDKKLKTDCEWAKVSIFVSKIFCFWSQMRYYLNLTFFIGKIHWPPKLRVNREIKFNWCELIDLRCRPKPTWSGGDVKPLVPKCLPIVSSILLSIKLFCFFKPTWWKYFSKSLSHLVWIESTEHRTDIR